MNRDKLFKKYSKHEKHTYELSETLSYTDETGREPDISFIYSGRDRGKSFEVCTQCLADSYYDGKQFAYVRRNDDTVDMIQSYFADKSDFIQDMTDGESDQITVYKSVLYFSHLDEDEKIVRDKEAGRFFSLSKQARYKSLQFPKIFRMLFEEVLTDGSYLPAEPEKLMNLYSTISRGKPDFKVYLISNLVSQVNPYSFSWGINIGRSKPGEVTLSKLYLGVYDKQGHEKYLLIAAHYLKDMNGLSKEDLKKNRNRVKTGIANNRWDELKLYTVIDQKFIKQFDILETAIFEYDDIMFQFDILEVPENIIEIYVDPEVQPSQEVMYIGYIRKKTTEPWINTRIYTNHPERMLKPYATKGMKIRYKIDNYITVLKENGWIAGCTNLVMNDFDNVYSKLRLLH